LASALKIKAGFGAAFAILLGVGFASVFQTFVWEGSAAWVSRTWDTIGRLDELALRSKDAEGAARSLAMGSADADADASRCRDDLRRVGQLTLDIHRLTGDSPLPAEDDAALGNLTAEQAARLDAGLAPASSAGMLQALREYDRAATGARLEAAVRKIQLEERAFLKGQTDQETAVAIRTRRLSEFASALSFCLILLAAWRTSVDVQKRSAAERALAAREEQYRQVVEMAGDLIFRTDALGRVTFCNQTSLAMLHLTEGELIGRSWLKLVRADRRRGVERFYLRQFARRAKSTYFEFPIVDGHGDERWVGQNVQLLTDGERATGFQSIAREITERKRVESELEKSRTFIQRIAATTPGILYVYDLDERRNIFSNREVLAVLGYKPEEMQKRTDAAAEYYHPEDLAAVRGHYDALRQAQDGEVRRIEYRARHSAGHWIWLSSRDTPFERGRDGRVRQIVGIAQDITVRKTAQEKLAYQANFDSLTGVANRQHFRARLQSILRRAGMENSTVALCVLDLDRFKEINDRFGHTAGDEVLENVGGILRSELRSHDLAGRLGGDEFAFFLPTAAHDEAAGVAERIRERLATSPYSVTATCGIAVWAAPMDAKELMEAADRALYRAKEAGRNRVCVHVAGLQSRAG